MQSLALVEDAVRELRDVGELEGVELPKVLVKAGLVGGLANSFVVEASHIGKQLLFVFTESDVEL